MFGALETCPHGVRLLHDGTSRAECDSGTELLPQTCDLLLARLCPDQITTLASAMSTPSRLFLKAHLLTVLVQRQLCLTAAAAAADGSPRLHCDGVRNAWRWDEDETEMVDEAESHGGKAGMNRDG